MAAVLAAVVGLAVGAQAGIITTSMTGGTTNQYNYVAAAATNTPLAVLSVPQSTVLSVLATFSCTASNSAVVTLRFDTSVDNSHWVSNTLAWPITANGTSTVTASTNLTVGATPFVRVRVVENPANGGTGGVTNLLVNGFTKNGM
jgi:hypothetical protein